MLAWFLLYVVYVCESVHVYIIANTKIKKSAVLRALWATVVHVFEAHALLHGFYDMKRDQNDYVVYSLKIWAIFQTIFMLIPKLKIFDS